MKQLFCSMTFLYQEIKGWTRMCDLSLNIMSIQILFENIYPGYKTDKVTGLHGADSLVNY